jgi:hypothetical protein
VAARDRKLTGRNTETIRHDSGGGGSYSNRHGGSGNGGGGGGDGSDGSSGDGHEEHNPRRLLLLATLRWLAAGALAAAALVAALPSLLSHPAGLKLVLAAVNLASPLALTVHLDSAQLGWQQPLLLSGLRLVERSGGSGEGDYSSSDDEEPLPVPQPDSAAASSSSGSSTQQGGRLRGLRRRRDAAAAPATAASAGQAVEGDSAAAASSRRRRTLVSVERVSTTRTLWQLLHGGGAVDCVVSKPQIDCTLNASGMPRLLAALQQAKVLPQAHPAPAQQAAGTAAVAALAVPSTTALAGQPAGQNGGAGGGASKASSSSSKAQASARQAGRSAAAAAAAAAPSKQRQRHDDSSDSEAEEAVLPVHRAVGQRGSSADKQPVSPAALLGYMMPAQGLKRSTQQREPQRAQQEAQPPAQQAGGSGSGAAGSDGSAAGGSSGSRSWVPESLQVASSAVKVTGEVNTGKLSLCVSEGALLVPIEARELLGKHLHFEVLQGASAIEEAAADEQPAAPASTSAVGSSTAGAAAGAAAAKRPPAAKWVRQRPAVLLPWGSGMPQMPVQLRLDGELMQFSLQGWQTTKGFTYLRRPVEARMRFTPALSKCAQFVAVFVRV